MNCACKGHVLPWISRPPALVFLLPGLWRDRVQRSSLNPSNARGASSKARTSLRPFRRINIIYFPDLRCEYSLFPQAPQIPSAESSPRIRDYPPSLVQVADAPDTPGKSIRLLCPLCLSSPLSNRRINLTSTKQVQPTILFGHSPTLIAGSDPRKLAYKTNHRASTCR